MKKLGEKVLTKIQNLISEIQKPKKSARRRKEKNISVGEIQNQSKAQIFTKMSYSFLTKQNKVANIHKQKVYQQQKQFEKYKVTNKHTINILNKKKVRPIHQRIDQIMEKKQKYIQQLRDYYNDKERESMVPDFVNIQQINQYKKFNDSELEDYRKDIDQRNKERLKKKHFIQLSFVKKDQFTGIPSIEKVSRSLSTRRNLKKKYSENVFKRLSQYAFESKQRKYELLQKRKYEEGGFMPVIDHRSQLIVDRSKSKRSLSQKVLNNSHHLHCQSAMGFLKSLAAQPRVMKSTSRDNQLSDVSPIRSKNPQLSQTKAGTKQKLRPLTISPINKTVNSKMTKIQKPKNNIRCNISK